MFKMFYGVCVCVSENVCISTYVYLALQYNEKSKCKWGEAE